MQPLSPKASLAYGWQTFKARPGILISAFLLVFGASLLIQGAQTGIDTLATIAFGSNAPLAAVIAVTVAFVGAAASLLVNMGTISFYLRAHDSIESVSLASLWHPHSFLQFAAASILVSLLILIGLLAFIIPGIILAIMFGFTPYVVIDRGERAIEAMRTSKQLVQGNWKSLLLLGLAIIGINVLGAVVLLVGLLVSIPVSILAVVHAYRTLSQAQATHVPVTVDA